MIGSPLTVPHGYDRLSDCLIERFPDDADGIRRFVARICATQMALKIFMEKHSGRWWLAHGAELPYRLWLIVRDIRSSVSEVMARYFGNNEAIKMALCANLIYYSDDPDQMWWLFYTEAQGGFLHGGGNYIKGGSQVLSDQLVARVRTGGGEALSGRSAIEILLGEHGEAAGVRYRHGGNEQIAHAPIVLANAAPHAVQHMLPESVRSEFMAPYRDKPLSISLFSMTFGLKRPPSELGVSAYSTHLIPSWMERLDDLKHCAAIIAEMPSDRMPLLTVVDYSRIDTGLNDGELYPVSVVGVDRLSNWEALSDTDYQAKKNAWLDAVIERLNDEWPGFANAIVQRDFATARTMHEHLGTPGGAIYGFAPNVPKRMLLSGPPRSPQTSIDGLWLASSYAGAGGFTGAMTSGGIAAKAALREFGEEDCR